MNNPAFSDYITEYQSIGIGSLIYNLIYKVVDNIVRRYPPAVYSTSNVWDEDAISGICHDFIIDKLLIKGWLEYYLFALNSLEGLERVLKRDFRHFLISKKTRTEKTNLYSRVKQIFLSNAQFSVIDGSGTNGALLGLAEWSQKEISLSRYEVSTVMATIQLPAIIRYRSDSRKTSPLISNPDLIRLIEGTFLLLDKRTTFQVLFDSICNRLGVLSDDVISLDDSIREDPGLTVADSVADPKISIEAEVLSKQIAEDIYDRLSDRQREILALQFELNSPTLVVIGGRLGISKSTVSNEIGSIERLLRESLLDSLDANDVILSLKQLIVVNHATNRSI